MGHSPDGPSATGVPADDAASSGPARLAAVVLAGGRASRFGGGADKTRALLGGYPLLEHVLAAVPDGVPCVVVGPRQGLAVASPAVTWTLESDDDRFSGPAVALAAGLAALPGGVNQVLVLAGDQPFVAPAVRVLVAQRERVAGPFEGVVAVDDAGELQPLLGLYAVGPLRRAVVELAGLPRSPSVKQVLARLSLLRVPVPPGSTVDVDTRADLDAARARRPSGDLGFGDDPAP